MEEKTNKIIIFRYPVWLDPDFLMDDSRILSVRRNKVRRVDKSQVIALMRGDIPESIFVNGLGKRKVARYTEEVDMCMKCSRWGHQAWSCQMDERCRYCGGSHYSTRCGEKIRANMRVVPKCCNCGGPHNARASFCPKRPGQRRQARESSTSGEEREGAGLPKRAGQHSHQPPPPHPAAEPHLYPSPPPPPQRLSRFEGGQSPGEQSQVNSWRQGRPNLSCSPKVAAQVSRGAEQHSRQSPPPQPAAEPPLCPSLPPPPSPRTDRVGSGETQAQENQVRLTPGNRGDLICPTH